MKYLSLLILVLALFVSWLYVHNKPDVTEYTHKSIQSDMKRIIAEYIGKTLPTSKDLKFERMWTENVKKNQVKASFVYSFLDSGEKTGNTRVQVEGYGILNKNSVKSREEEVWSFDELHILNNEVEYKDPITIGPTANSNDK